VTSLDAAEGIAEVSIADVGALVKTNADSASAKPTHGTVIVLIETLPPVSLLGLVRTITPSTVNVFPGLRHLQGGRRGGFRITIFDERSRGDSSKPRLERVVVAGE